MGADAAGPTSRVLAIETAPPAAAAEYFHRMRLSCETDPFDVRHDQESGTAEFVLVDARTAEAHAGERIPGAVSLPHAELVGDVLAGLDRDRVHVTYGWGPACNAATRAAALLAGSGVRVKEMIGGLEYWKRAGYPTERDR